ncbi:MAG: NTE family protein [Ilumatobacter sp.]|jgi:NTE family protein
MPSVGVVLGAGGVIGAAYHAGVLTALAEAGFDARDAELIVGTSAGSAVGATLRAGFPPLDLTPRSLGEPVSDEAAAIVGRTDGPLSLDLRPRPFSLSPLPASPKLLLRLPRHPAKALAGLLPTGTIATNVIGERISMMYGDRSWPERPLWICAVDLEDGDRVVFGRDAPEANVGVAVQASSSIPGLFRPVEHGGRRYVDGGVHSPTNADLLADQGFDIVVVVSPMSATRLAHGTLLPNARLLHSRRLANEVDRLRQSGTEVLTFQPTSDVVATMGRNAMASARRAPTTRVALASARKRLNDPQVSKRLELLRAASAA